MRNIMETKKATELTTLKFVDTETGVTYEAEYGTELFNVFMDDPMMRVVI